VTREQQDTDRTLVRAEHDWLVARGWSAHGATLGGLRDGRVRYSHPGAPTARADYTARDALAMTRGDPLRYMARRYVTPGPA